jgi:hypothetical protein
MRSRRRATARSFTARAPAATSARRVPATTGRRGTCHRDQGRRSLLSHHRGGRAPRSSAALAWGRPSS